MLVLSNGTEESNDTVTVPLVPPPQEDIPSFSEWAQKQLAEAEKRRGTHLLVVCNVCYDVDPHNITRPVSMLLGYRIKQTVSKERIEQSTASLK